MSLNNNSISLAGEFAVLSQLMLKGYNANLTLGNTKGVDILVSHPETGKMFKLEVKTNYRKITSKPINSKIFGKFYCSWMMNVKHEKIDKNLFYCFVNINKENNYARFFILPSEVVASYVKEEFKHWVKKGIKKNKKGKMRTFRIGFNSEKHSIECPTIEKFEDNWDFK